METVTVTTEAGVFEFRAEERIMDSLQIEQTAVKYAGGYEALSELKLLSTKYYDEYHQKLKEMLGNERYSECVELLRKGDESSEEKQKIIKEFVQTASAEFSKFLEVNTMFENVYKIARAAVLQVFKTGTTRLEQLPTPDALKVIEKLEEELIFFRRQKAPTTSDNTAI